MANCSGIFSGATVDCLDPLAVGLEQRLFLANLADVETITYSVTPGEENVIEGITMKSGKSFFEFEGINQTIKAQSELVRGDLAVSYKHQIDLSVFEVDNVSLNNLQAMAYKNQIAITVGPNDSSLGNGPFQVHGKNVGMELASNVRIPGDNATGAAFVLQMATAENGGAENELPNVFWDTDYPTTLAKIEALLIAAP